MTTPTKAAIRAAEAIIDGITIVEDEREELAITIDRARPGGALRTTPDTDGNLAPIRRSKTPPADHTSPERTCTTTTASTRSPRTGTIFGKTANGTEADESFTSGKVPAYEPVTAEELPTGMLAGWQPKHHKHPEAVDLAFADNCRYGQIIKDYRNTDQPGRYGPPEMVGTERREIFGAIDLPTICTSHVERVNLTTRTLMKRFTRLSLCFSKKLENLVAATAIYVAYYNFCWQHKSLGGKTPAMAAGVTGHPWSIEELFERVVGE